MKDWSYEKKLEYDIKLHKELSLFYELICKLVIVCIRNETPLIIENPYSTQHYLQRYWCIKPSVIDNNRKDSGDYFKKPTQYWFINRKPSNNLTFEPQVINKTKKVSDESGINRSLISPDYASRFIKEFII